VGEPVKDRRAIIRRRLNKLYLPYYDALCKALFQDQQWQPYSGYRSFEEQTRIYNQGRLTPGPIVTKAKPGTSSHNYGCSSDWCLWEGNDPEWPDNDDIIWNEYLRACGKAGVKTLGFEMPHNELPLRGVTWVDVHEVFETKGMNAAQLFIEKHAKPFGLKE
jgi:hypothetical protein